LIALCCVTSNLLYVIVLIQGIKADNREIEHEKKMISVSRLLMVWKYLILIQCRLLKLHLTLSYGEGWVRRLRKGLSK
jgi:hypothetical protein